MVDGKTEIDLAIHLAASDDAWERDSRIMWGLEHLRTSVLGMFGEKVPSKTPDDFNDSLRGPDDVGPVAADDDYPWAEEAPAD